MTSGGRAAPKRLCSARSKLPRAQRKPGSHPITVSHSCVSTAFSGHIHPPPEDASACRLTGTSSHTSKGATGDTTTDNFAFSFPGMCKKGLCSGSTGSCAVNRAFTGPSHAPGENTFSFSRCHGNRLRARILACSSSAQQKLACVPGLWRCPYPTASRERGSEVTQGPHCTKQDFYLMNTEAGYRVAGIVAFSIILMQFLPQRLWLYELN